MSSRALIVSIAVGVLLALVQLLTALASGPVAIGGGLVVGLIAVGATRFFHVDNESRWTPVGVALVGSLVGVLTAALADAVEPLWMLAIPPPLALLTAAALQITKGGGKRCQLCEKRLGGPAFSCPRCGLAVGEACCWVHDKLRCRLCEQNSVPLFTPDSRWWDRTLGPRLNRGRCQITLEDAQSADLRGCPKCGRPQSRSAWDLNNGSCARCGFQLEDVPDRLAAYLGYE